MSSCQYLCQIVPTSVCESCPTTGRMFRASPVGIHLQILSNSTKQRLLHRNSSDPSLTMSKTTVLKDQHAKLLFPPWYQIPAEEGESTTTTTLTLIPPSLSMGSTFSTDLMSMTYVG